MRKRFTALLLTLVLACGLLPTAAFAVEEETTAETNAALYGPELYSYSSDSMSELSSDVTVDETKKEIQLSTVNNTGGSVFYKNFFTEKRSDIKANTLYHLQYSITDIQMTKASDGKTPSIRLFGDGGYKTDQFLGPLNASYYTVYIRSNEDIHGEVFLQSKELPNSANYFMRSFFTIQPGTSLSCTLKVSVQEVTQITEQLPGVQAVTLEMDEQVKALSGGITCTNVGVASETLAISGHKMSFSVQPRRALVSVVTTVGRTSVALSYDGKDGTYSFIMPDEPVTICLKESEAMKAGNLYEYIYQALNDKISVFPDHLNFKTEANYSGGDSGRYYNFFHTASDKIEPNTTYKVCYKVDVKELSVPQGVQAPAVTIASLSGGHSTSQLAQGEFIYLEEVKTYSGEFDVTTSSEPAASHGMLRSFFGRSNGTVIDVDVWIDVFEQASIVFDTDGGSEVEAITQVLGTVVTAKPSEPTRTGYTFNGWDQELPAIMPKGGLVIKAQWTPNTDTPYVVNHYKQNADGSYPVAPDETDSLTGTTDADTTATAKTYEGFTGTVTQQPISGDGSTVVDIYYVRDSYAITYHNMDNATHADDYPQSHTYGIPTVLKEPTWSGYTFGGWYRDAAFTDKVEILGETDYISDIDLYAKWTKHSSSSNHRITVEDSENGQIKSNRTYAGRGSTVTLTVTPDEGYQLASLSVADSTGQTVEVIDNGDGKYTFQMPGGRVIVAAIFATILCDGGETCPSERFTDLDLTLWYHEAIDYVVSRDTMIGTTETTFAPNSTTTRAMIWTVLARMAGETIEGSNWAADAQEWAVKAGISDGTNADWAVTREQLVTMLYRFVDTPSGAADLSQFADSGEISAYAQPAMAWAVAIGLLQGDDQGLLNPGDTATRAEVATILMRFCQTVAI